MSNVSPWSSGAELLSRPEWGDDIALRLRKGADDALGVVDIGARGWGGTSSVNVVGAYTKYRGPEEDGFVPSIGGQNYAITNWIPDRGLVFGAGGPGSAGSTDERIYSYISHDGFTWTKNLRDGGLTVSPRGIAYSKELDLAVAVGFTGVGPGATDPCVMTSRDGETWTVSSPGLVATSAWRAVTWAPELGLFCAFAGSTYNTTEASAATRQVATSPDGQTWTARTVPSFRAVVFAFPIWSPDLKMFLIPTDSSVGWISYDGITWTEVTMGGSRWRGGVWAPELGLFCVTGAASNPTLKIGTSPDGINWTLREGPNMNRLGPVTWLPNPGLFLVFAIEGTGNRVMTSPDGINWTVRTQVEPGLDGSYGVLDIPSLNRLVLRGSRPLANL